MQSVRGNSKMRSRLGKTFVLFSAAVLLSVLAAVVFRDYRGPITRFLGLRPPTILRGKVGAYDLQITYDEDTVRLVVRDPISGSDRYAYEGGPWARVFDFSSEAWFPTAEDYSRLMRSNPPDAVWSKDINGDGYEEYLVITSWRQAPTPCNLSVRSCGRNLDLLLWEYEIAEPPLLVDEDEDGMPEILIREHGFAGWRGMKADPLKPLAIYKWRDGGYTLSTPDFLPKYAASLESAAIALREAVKQKNAGHVNKPKDTSGELEPPLPLWGVMLDYIYFGEGTKARGLFEELWPEGAPGKEENLREFDDNLRKNCRLWPETNLVTPPEKRWPAAIGEGEPSKSATPASDEER